MEGKSLDSVGTSEKVDFTKPQAPTERKISVSLQLIETKIIAVWDWSCYPLLQKKFYSFEIIFFILTLNC